MGAGLVCASSLVRDCARSVAVANTEVAVAQGREAFSEETQFSLGHVEVTTGAGQLGC